MESEGLIWCDVKLEAGLALISFFEMQLNFLSTTIKDSYSMKPIFKVHTASEMKKPLSRNAPLITLLKLLIRDSKRNK